MAVTILVLSFLILLILGVPIAFCIGFASMLTFLVGMPPDVVLPTVAQRMATGLNSFPLLAIPFFILAGQLMNQGGVAKRLIDFAKSLIGWLPGALAHINIVANMLFGAISGSAAAAASAIGSAMHDPMVDEGYDPEYNAAVNIASATTGMIIPPSNIIIVYSLAAGGVSIGALFVAGYVPGILIGLALMLVAGVIAVRKKYPVAQTIAQTSVRQIWHSFIAALPSLLLLIIVIGGIIAGIFTATEASAIAVLYALILSLIYREIGVKELPDVVLKSVETTAIVMILIATSMAMSWVMAFENIPQDLSAALLSLSDSKVVILLIINIFLLLVGIFMDMTPAVLIFTPIFLPVVEDLDINLIHFGIMMVMNLCIGLCTPPVGAVLFVGSAVAKVRISDVVRPILPFFVAMLVVLMLTTYLPELSLWLPRFFGLIE